MDTLKNCIKMYRDLDNTIRVANRSVHELREKRKILETQMKTILVQPQFTGFDKLKIEDDGSTIRIQRPNTWNKSWTLSKKELSDSVAEYFASTSQPNSTDCTNFIVEKQKTKLVSTDFAFTRTILNENVETE